MNGAWFGVLIEQMGERHGHRYSESSVDVKYFAGFCWNMITVELWMNI